MSNEQTKPAPNSPQPTPTPTEGRPLKNDNGKPVKKK